MQPWKQLQSSRPVFYIRHENRRPSKHAHFLEVQRMYMVSYLLHLKKWIASLLPAKGAICHHGSLLGPKSILGVQLLQQRFHILLISNKVDLNVIIFIHFM